MTQQRDIERLLDQWFSDGPDQAPDRVVDIVTDRSNANPATRLAPPLKVTHCERLREDRGRCGGRPDRGRRRLQPLPTGSTGIGGPSPSASPTATPAATAISLPGGVVKPSANAVYPAWFTETVREPDAARRQPDDPVLRARLYLLTVPGRVGPENSREGVLASTGAVSGHARHVRTAASKGFAHE